MDTAIFTQKLTKKFGNFKAVDEVDLHISHGESYALLGPDGAGKTTTMRLLCGALRPTSGKIMINGTDLLRNTDQAREYIGYMPQKFSLYENLSVLQNINFFADIYNVSKPIRQSRMAELLEFSRLTPFTDRLAGRLSGGMKQKLALVCTVINKPSILLLDEPTTGVDPVSRRDFWRILHRLLAEGVTLFISTPYMDEAERCNRIGLMHHGNILLVNTPTELKQRLTGEVIEIKCKQPYIASENLKSQDFVISTQAFSDKVRVLLKDRSKTQEILNFLESKGIIVSNIYKTIPSIEDIFISKLSE